MKRDYVFAFITIFLLSFVSVAYAAFNSELTITGEGVIQRDTVAPTCGAWYLRDSSLTIQQAYDQNKFINPGTNTTWTNTDKKLFIECSDNMAGDYGCIGVTEITDSNNHKRYFKEVKEYTTSVQTDSNVVTVTLKDAYLNERTCTLPVGGSNPYIDKDAPVVTITRNAANKFTYSATDNNQDEIEYIVATSSTEPALDDSRWSSTTETVTIDNTSAKTYYVWVKDGANISHQTISSFLLTKTQGTGTILNLKYQNSNGETLSTGYVLNGTEVYADALLQNGYNSLVFKKNNVAINTGNIHTMNQPTTFSTNSIPNTYIVSFNANGGTGSINNESFTYGVSKALTSNTFVRRGYLFNNWNTSADGTGVSYSDGQSVSNITTTNNGTVILYAIWKRIMAENIEYHELEVHCNEVQCMIDELHDMLY